MQIFYALPFLALSAIAFIACLVIPSLRRHLVAAAVAPVAFGFWSIVSVAAALLIGDAVGFSNENGSVLMGFVYVVSGIAGAWLSVWLTRAVLRRLLA